MIMYKFKNPYGFINIQLITSICKTKRYFYIVDDCGNYLLTDEETFNELKNIGIKERSYK